jgi:transcriptional regulator with XRE-family HTH domain
MMHLQITFGSSVGLPLTVDKARAGRGRIMADALHGPVVVRRRLGAKLRELRAQAHLGLDQVAHDLEFSTAKLSRLETGQVVPKIRDVRDLLEMYEVPDELRRQLLAWAEDAKSRGWWQPLPPAQVPVDLDLYISLEAEASAVKQFSAAAIPGLMQTEDYARAIISATVPHRAEDGPVIEELVKIRLHRFEVLAPQRAATGQEPLELYAVVDEAALHRGPVAILRGQLAQLLARSEMPNVHVQVFPFEEGFDEAHSTFSIFEPHPGNNDWPVVNVESTGHDHFYDSTEDVAMFNDIWSDLTSRALTADDSRELIATRLARLIEIDSE